MHTLEWITNTLLNSLLCIAPSCVNITGFGSRHVFGERIYSWIFLHDAFYIGVRQETPKLILRTILDIYPHLNFIYKGMSIVKKLDVWCNSS